MKKSERCHIPAQREAIRLHQHPAYEPSEIAWLGDVPKHWRAGKLRHILSDTTTRKRPDLPLLSVVREKGVILRDIEDREDNHNFIPDDLSNYKVVEVGQLAMNKMKAWQGSFGISKFNGIVSPAYFIFDVKGVQSDFFHKAIRSMAYVPFFTQASDGVRIGQWDLSKERMQEIPFFVPPLDEQRAIVRYLDRADERIQRAISAKERLIGLLTEQRQAVIHHTVTRGLDPNVRLKDSGVEWLGDVPKHWEVRRIKSLSAVKRGASPRPIDDPRYFDDDGEYAWVRISDVTASSRYLKKTTQRLSEIGQALSVKMEPGTLFLSIAGSVGKPIITDIKCCIHDGFVYFPYFKGNVEFLYRILSIDGPFTRLGKLGTQLNLNTETVGNIYLGWPPLDEQAAIIHYLNNATADIDVAIDNTQQQIDLLREYRTRLIADVVTGQVDVGEA